MRLARILLPLLLAASPAFALDRFVATTGGPVSGPTFCDGTQAQTLATAQANQDCSGPGGVTGQCPCYYSSPAHCASGTLTQPALVAGETCHVAAGRYTTGNSIIPTNSGTSGNPIRFVCDTDQVENYVSTEALRCTIQTGSGSTMADLRGKSYIEMDGFTFEAPDTGTSAWTIELWGKGASGSVDCDPTGGTTNCSQGVAWKHIKVRERGGTPPFITVRSWGGGRVTGNSISDSWLHMPYWCNPGSGGCPSSVTQSGFVLFGYSPSNTNEKETNTQVNNTWIIGGRNTLTLTDVINITFDKGGSFSAKNHMTDWCNQTIGGGCSGVTFKNWVFGGPAEFREPVPQVLGGLANLTILNSYITGAWQFPFDSHDCQLTGTLTFKNNIVANLDSGKSTPAAHANAGCTGAGCVNGTCASSVLTYNVDYNAYLFTNDTVSSTQFSDQRGKTCASVGNCTAPVTFTGTNIAGWRTQTGFDAHSVVYLAKDWDGSASTVGSVTPARVFGNSAPLWYSPDVANFSGSTSPNIRKFSSAQGYLQDVRADQATLSTNPYFFQYDLDGTMRQLTDIQPTSNANAACTSSQYCQYDLTFTPMIDRDGDGTFDGATSSVYGDKPTGDRWAFWYGRQRDVNADGTNDFSSGLAAPHLTYLSWGLHSTSPLIEIGDPATCGHTALDADGTGGARCDIGPVEYDGVPPPTGDLELTVSDLVISAESSTVSFTVNQSDSSTSATNFTWGTSATGAAEAGTGACSGTEDYITVTGGSGSFSSGGTGPKTTTIGPITICPDTLFELPESFSVVISGATNATDTVTIVDSTGVGTIGNDDPPPTFSVAGSSNAESAGAVTNTPTISAAAGTTITLTYTVASGTATVGTTCSTGVDVAASGGTLSWTSGNTSPTAGITLTLCDDAAIEASETFNVNFSSATPTGMVVPSPITFTITDNDSAPSVTTLRGVTIRGVSLNGAPSGAGTLQLGTVTGSATLLPAGDPSCLATPDYPCAIVSVSGCPSVTESRDVYLYVANKLATAPALGTVTLAGGGRGTALWEASLPTVNRTAITTLRNVGYRIVQIVWAPPGWNSDESSADYATSEKYMACRTATLYKWIHDNFVAVGAPFCTIGNSSGAEGIAYAMAYYGAADYIDAAYLGAGPYGTRLDLGCTQAPLDGLSCTSVYGLPETANAGKGLISEAFGGPDSDGDGTDDCTEADDGSGATAQALAAWRAASLGYATGTCPDSGTFYYPNTWVTLNSGQYDSPTSGTCDCDGAPLNSAVNCTNAPAHADLYHDELDNTINGRGGATTCHATQTQLDQNVIANTGHTLQGTATGVTAWQEWVYVSGAANKCKAWP